MKNAWILALSLFACGLFAHAAPIPGTSSSSLIGPEMGRYISSSGFTLNAGQSTWTQNENPKGIDSVATVYKGPLNQDGVQAALTVSIDQLNKKTSLKNYIKRWSKDYPRFGFDILASKPVKVNNEVAYLFDLVNKDTKKQIRQVVFVKEERAVILTCRDQISSFNENLKECNSIIRTFAWTE